MDTPLKIRFSDKLSNFVENDENVVIRNLIDLKELYDEKAINSENLNQVVYQVYHFPVDKSMDNLLTSYCVISLAKMT